MDTNALEILISARDQSSETLSKVGAGLQGIGKQAGFAAERVGELGKGLFSVGEVATGVVKNLFISVFNGVGQVLSLFAGLYSGFGRIKATIESPVGQAFFSEIGTAIDKIVAKTQSLTKVLGDVGFVLSNVGAGINGTEMKQVGSKLAVNLTNEFNVTLKQELAAAVNQIDKVLETVLTKLEKGPKRLAGAFGGFADAIEPIAGAAEPLGIFKLIEDGIGASTGAIFEFSQKIAFLGLGFQALKGLVENGPFDLLIGQNIRLQEQLLSTQASLAATNNIVLNGNKISDPTQAIKALGPAVEEAIAKIRKDSLDLVGVTSKDLVELFQIVAGQASNIGANLTQVADIVSSTAAALGTLGVPLFQSRQEISSIIQGSIDMNSVLAKNLNINNEMVAKWKAQGTFVDELLKRLEAFKSGNKLASQTVSGITSNIQELFDEIGRVAGAKFLAPIVNELDSVYKFLSQNKDVIADGLGKLVAIFAQAVGNIVNSLKTLSEPFFKIFATVPTYLFKSLSNFTEALSNSIGLAVTILRPALEVFAALAPAAGALGGIFLALSVGAKTLAFSVGFLDKAFNFLAVTLPNVGEVLFFLEQRNNGLINKFASLTDVVGKGSAGFLLLGENLLSIPGAAGATTKELGKMLGGLAPFAPALTSMIPLFSGIAIKVVGLTQVFPELIPVLQKVGVAIPSALRGLQGVTSLNETFSSLAPVIGKAADQFERLTEMAGKEGAIDELFSNTLNKSGAAIKSFVVQSLLLGAGAFVGFIFFDQLILKNKGLQIVLESVTKTIRNFADAVTEKLAPLFNIFKEIFVFLFQFQKDENGKGGNLFGNIIGGVIAAIVAVRLFGNVIATAFKGLNVGISTLGDNIVASVTRLEKVRQSISSILGADPNRRTLVNEKEAPAIISAKKAEISEQVVIAKEARGRYRDPTLSSDNRLLAKTESDAALAKAREIKSELNKIDVATPLSTQIKNTFSSLFSQLSGAATAVSSFAKKLGSDIKFALNDIEASFRSRFAGVSNIVGGAIAGIKGVGSAIASEVKTFAADPSKYLLSTGIAIEATARSYLSAASASIKQFVGDFRTNIQKLPQLALDAFRSITSGSGMLKGLAANIGDFFKTLDLQAGNALTKFTEGFKASFKTIGKSFLSLASELGPTLLIGGAVTVFTAAIGEIDRQNQLATKSSKNLADALKDIDTKLRIRSVANGKDAEESISKLSKERKNYIDSFKDQSKLKDDPTLSVYDAQLARLKELRRLQDTPLDTENKLRAQVKKNRDNFGTRVAEVGGVVGDAFRNVLSVGGLDKSIGLGDRAGNLEEKEVQTIQADSGTTFAEIAQRASDLKTTGLIEQQNIEKDLIKLEQQKATASATGNNNEVDRIDILIKAKQEVRSENLNNIDTLIKQAEATQDVDGKQGPLIEKLKQVKIQLEGAKIAIEAVDLPRVGNAIEQATLKYNAALEALNKAAGDPALFKAKLGELLEVSKELQDAGVLRANEVAANFIKIATNVNADRDLQIKAQQSITEAYQKEAQRRIAIYDVQIAKVQLLLATGKISESESTTLTSELEQKKIQEDFNAKKKGFDAELVIIKARETEQLNQIQRERDVATAQKAAASGDVESVRKVGEAQKPKVLEDIEKTKKLIVDAKQAEATLVSERDRGLIPNDKASDGIKKASDRVAELAKQLRSLQDQEGQLDSALKLTTDSQSQLDNATNSIKKAGEEISALEKKKTLLEAAFKESSRFLSPIGSKKGEIEAKLNATNAELAEKKAKELEDKAKKAQLESIIKPDPEAQKRADTTIVSQDSKRTALLKASAAQEKKIREDLANAEEKNAVEVAKKKAEEAVRNLETQAKTALEAQKLGETQRLGDLAKLRKRGIILESEAKLQETAERKKSIDLELSLEQQKLAKFDELAKKGLGVSQATRRASILKIAELTKQQTEAELAAIDNVVAAIRDRLTLAANQYGLAIDQQNLKLDRQKLLYTALEKSLGNQERLAQSAKKLNDSIVAVREADLNVLTKIYDKQQQAIRDAGGTGNSADKELEEKKLLLAEQIAKIKLESLIRQQVFERESLEREIQKRDLMLEQQKLKNEIDLALKKKDLAIAEVGVKSAEAEVKLRPESPEAKLRLDLARLEQQKKELEYAGLVQEKGFIGKTGELNKSQALQEREGLQNTQFAQRTTANTEFASALTDPVLQQQLLQEIEAQTMQRAFGTQGQTRITGDQARGLINAPISTTQGESLTDPSKYAEFLRRSEANPNGTLTTEVIKPKNNSFATTFEELQQKYPDKGIGSIADLNKKYAGKDATTFEELNAKYSGKPETTTDPIAKIGSSFDELNTQIDAGFAKVLDAPTYKVNEMTAGLEAQFNKITTQIKENPVIISLDNEALAKAKAELAKPLKVLDEDQLLRLEGILAALGQGGKNIDIKSAGTNAASAGATTINAPITVNSNDGNSSQDVSKVVNNALDALLKKVANVTASTK